jgi:hypothetical protein
MSAIETLKELVKLAFSILCSLTILALLLALLERSVRFLLASPPRESAVDVV